MPRTQAATGRDFRELVKQALSSIQPRLVKYGDRWSIADDGFNYSNLFNILATDHRDFVQRVVERFPIEASATPSYTIPTCVVDDQVHVNVWNFRRPMHIHDLYEHFRSRGMTEEQQAAWFDRANGILDELTDLMADFLLSDVDRSVRAPGAVILSPSGFHVVKNSGTVDDFAQALNQAVESATREREAYRQAVRAVYEYPATMTVSLDPHSKSEPAFYTFATKTYRNDVATVFSKTVELKSFYYVTPDATYKLDQRDHLVRLELRLYTRYNPERGEFLPYSVVAEEKAPHDPLSPYLLVNTMGRKRRFLYDNAAKLDLPVDLALRDEHDTMKLFRALATMASCVESKWHNINGPLGAVIAPYGYSTNQDLVKVLATIQGQVNIS